MEGSLPSAVESSMRAWFWRGSNCTSPQRPEIACGRDPTGHSTVDKSQMGAESGFQGCDPHGVPSQSSLEKRNKWRGSYRGELGSRNPWVPVPNLQRAPKTSGIKKRII